MMKVRKTTVILKQGGSVVPRLFECILVSRLDVASFPGSFLHFGHGNEARLNVTAGLNL